MEEKTWKVLAIVFICLFVAETIYFIWLLNVGDKILMEESYCADECYKEAGFYSFNYDTRICYCINKEGEVVNTIDLT